MNKSKIEKGYTDVINNFNEMGTTRTQNFQKVIERLSELEKKGLLTKTSSTLLPIEDRHRYAFEYCENAEKAH